MKTYRGMRRIWVKTIAMVVVCLFLAQSLSLDLLQESAQVSADTLAPELRLTRPEFKDEYILGRTLLAHRALNKFIGDYIRETLKLKADEIGDLSFLLQYKTENVEITPNGEKRIIEIPVVGIPGLLKNTGQFGHVGLGKWNNIPVKYIDSAYFDIETDASRHETEEIARWETKRLELERELGIEIPYQKYRQVLNEFGVGKELRDEFHRSSVGLAVLYAEAEAKALVDVDKVYDRYQDKDYGGLDEGDSDFNVSGGNIAEDTKLVAHILRTLITKNGLRFRRVAGENAYDLIALPSFRETMPKPKLIERFSVYLVPYFLMRSGGDLQHYRDFVSGDGKDAVNERRKCMLALANPKAIKQRARSEDRELLWKSSQELYFKAVLRKLLTEKRDTYQKELYLYFGGVARGAEICWAIKLLRTLIRTDFTELRNRLRVHVYGADIRLECLSSAQTAVDRIIRAIPQEELTITTNFEWIDLLDKKQVARLRHYPIDCFFLPNTLYLNSGKRTDISSLIKTLRTGTFFLVENTTGGVPLTTDSPYCFSHKLLALIDSNTLLGSALDDDYFTGIFKVLPIVETHTESFASAPALFYDAATGTVRELTKAMAKKEAKDNKDVRVSRKGKPQPTNLSWRKLRRLSPDYHDPHIVMDGLPMGRYLGRFGLGQALKVLSKDTKATIKPCYIELTHEPTIGHIIRVNKQYILEDRRLGAVNSSEYAVIFVESEGKWFLIKGNQPTAGRNKYKFSDIKYYLHTHGKWQVWCNGYPSSGDEERVSHSNTCHCAITDRGITVYSAKEPTPWLIEFDEESFNLYPPDPKMTISEFYACIPFINTSETPEPSTHVDKSNPKKGGSPADYLVGVGENLQLQESHTISEYKEAVKPPVSDNTIRRDRQSLEGRGYLRKGEYRQKKGYEYSLTEEGRARFEMISGIKQTAGNAVYGFVNASFTLSDALENGEKVLYAIDEELGREGTERLVRQLIKDICDTNDSEVIKKKLRNIIFVKGRGKALADDVAQYTGDGKDGIKIKKENVIMITKSANETNCGAFKDGATITFVDDSKIDSMDYYPLMEVALFTLARALYNMGITGYDRDKLVSIYKSLTCEQVADDQIIPLIIDNKVVKITLRPVAPLNYDELQHIYRALRELLQAA